jgi:hypothetical protein
MFVLSGRIGRWLARSIAVTAAVGCLALATTPANAMEVTGQNGSFGQVVTDNLAVHCYNNRTISVNGTHVGPTSATNGQWVVQHVVWYKWVNGTWSRIYTDGGQTIYTYPGNTLVHFVSSAVSVSGPGYYTVQYSLEWYDYYGKLLGFRVVRPNTVGDFDAYYRYSGHPGSCYLT